MDVFPPSMAQCHVGLIGLWIDHNPSLDHTCGTRPLLDIFVNLH
jgi:hypothetical protein